MSSPFSPEPGKVRLVAHGTVGAGDVDIVRVEYTPTSADRRFGDFQLYVQGVPMGDGTTTAWYPHYQDLERLSRVAGRPETQRRRRLSLGDTFDHLDLYLELTPDELVFTFTARAEWGSLPAWAPQPGQRMCLSVTRSDFLAMWSSARPQFDRLRTREL